MSKKLAAGADAILLDVKCGSGAFMKTKEDAVALAKMMVSIGNKSGRRTVAAVTDMSQPLGMAVGNSLEVLEAIHTLKGQGPDDITKLSLELAGIMIYLGKKADSPALGKEKAKAAVQSGLALKKFEEFVSYQGGDSRITLDESLFPQPAHMIHLIAKKNGFVGKIDANIIGLASQHTGAGRMVMGDHIDMSAGMILHKKVGDPVTEGDVLATLYGNVKSKLEMGLSESERAFTISHQIPQKYELIHEIIGLDD